MSRWTTTFAGHPFRSQWVRVIEANDSIKPDDPAVLPHIEELSRLRKVIAYIDHAIQSVDPELLPLGFWDAIQGSVSGCAEQLIAFASSKNVGHLQQANLNLDNVLGQIRPYLLAKGKLGPALQAAAKSYSESLTSSADALREASARMLAGLSDTQQPA